MPPPPCQCGEPATERLTVRYRYPRAEPVPEAMDPYYVHGGGGLGTCGSPACEAAAMLAHRAALISIVRKHGGRELAGDEIDITAVRPQDITRTEQADGTVRESWPSPPHEAI
jgi:hypothetical protein